MLRVAISRVIRNSIRFVSVTKTLYIKTKPIFVYFYALKTINNMKKFYILILLTVISIQISTAQLVLTKSFNEPVIGNLITYNRWDSSATLVNTTGTNVLWNFSSLVANTGLSISNYTTVSSSTSAASYSNASYAETNGSGNYTFWKSTNTPTTQLELLGIVQPSLSVNLNANSAIASVWPIAYGYNKTDAFSGSAVAQTSISLSGTASGTIHVQASGSGTVILPGGTTYTNILQITTTQTLNVSLAFGLVNASIVSTNYQYYHGSQKFPLITVEYQTTTGTFSGNTGRIKINSNAIPITTGLNFENFKNDFFIFPNPAKNIVNISLSNPTHDNGFITIYNALNKTIKTIELGNAFIIEKDIDIFDLSSGIYFIKTTLGNKSYTKKLIVE